MAMAKLQHGSHECALTSPKIVANGICNICIKEEPVEFACDPCNFDLCKTCSDLPLKMSHHLHPDHPLEFCIAEDDRKTKNMICVGCGNMSSGAFYYECKKCDHIYLDLDCALQKNIPKSWEAKEMLHYSHEHLLRRCRPGPDATESCLLCERPVSFSTICYGCVHCRFFVHERCLSLPTEIQHPVHPMHPLKRLDYIQTFEGEKKCNACKKSFVCVPFGCLECGFYIHLTCADALLRGLLHESHEHKLFCVYNDRTLSPSKQRQCGVCKTLVDFQGNPYYHCIECDLKFHFDCLELPNILVKKSCHIHPLRLKSVEAKDDFLEYCGVCETMVHSKTLAYSCEECDFLGHIECILREEVPFPLYLKDLYSSIKDTTRCNNLNDHGTNELEDKLMVNSFSHIHVMRTVHMSELEEEANCNICREIIQDKPCQCETCSFQSHDFCAELGRPSSKYRFHSNHSLTLLPKIPRTIPKVCESCTKYIGGFNLFCRICDFIIDVKCALKDKKMHGALQMGQKIIGTGVGLCIQDKHSLFQVIVSRSYPIPCSICYETLCGKALSCVACGDICHPLCIQDARRNRNLVGHPLHYDHILAISIQSRGSKCTACQLNIIKYGYHCTICKLNFHIDCINAVIVPSEIKSHSHYLYNFWNNDMKETRACSVCARPCGVSFYGCIDCMFSAHVDCIGFPSNVKNQQHQHTLTEKYSSGDKKCSLCESKCPEGTFYSCYQCKDRFDPKCIMSKDNHKEATEEEQLQDIYLMYIERDLLDLLVGGMFEDSTVMSLDLLWLNSNSK